MKCAFRLSNEVWIKRNSESLFDVAMGCFDGAEIFNLVGLYLLNTVAKKFGNKYVGPYRDNGLILIKGNSARVADKFRNDLQTLFEQFNLKITALIDQLSRRHIKPN